MRSCPPRAVTSACRSVFTFGFVVLVWFSGCTTYLPRLEEGSPTSGDVVVAGRIAFDPPIDPESRSTNVRDPRGRYLRARLAFTRDGRALGDWREADAFAAVDPEQPFAIVVPRELRYLRGVFYHLGTRAIDARTYAILEMECNQSFEIPIEHDDRFVYVGTLTCRHDEGQPLEMQVRDDLPRDGQVLAARRPESPLVPRLLRPMSVR